MINEETELEPMAVDLQDEPAGASGSRTGSWMEMIRSLLSEPTAVPRRCTPSLDHRYPEGTKYALIHLMVLVCSRQRLNWSTNLCQVWAI